jgi:hypothetical protein
LLGSSSSITSGRIRRIRASATHFPAAGERADIALHHLLAEAEARQRLASPAVEGVTVELLETALHLAVTRDDRVHLVGTIRIGHRGLELFQLRRHDADRAGAVHDLGHGAAARHLADVLAEIADGDAAIERDLALVRRFLARNHPEKRGLAGPVGADEADLLALLERRGGFDEENLVADLLADVIETDHGGLKRGIGLAALIPCGAQVEGNSGRCGNRADIRPIHRRNRLFFSPKQLDRSWMPTSNPTQQHADQTA